MAGIVGVVFGILFVILGVGLEVLGVVAGHPEGLLAPAVVIAASGGVLIGSAWSYRRLCKEFPDG